ncbi:MAG: chemotaxis protein CheB [Pseudohongiella sp.]|nr:chemotaxis protein CheB [Pseudohongiella sp.]
MTSPSYPRAPSTQNNMPQIVGIGASAGGLAALEAFFGATSAGGNLAYIVVQHMDPTQKALLPELLQRITAMPVRQAEEGVRVAAGSVYVIAPNTELSVNNGVLHMALPSEPRGMRLPINVLFSSLARALGDRAIGVVLSGMGSDGTLGLQAIKAVGGLTVVQTPATAQFDSMPQSAVTAGCSHIVAPADALPDRIRAYLENIENRHAEAATPPMDPLQSSPLQQVVRQLRRQTRHDFSLYKTSTLQRRIERRMACHHIQSVAEYAGFLDNNSQEIDLLFKELLIGVTSFFRDTAVWEYFSEKALPELLGRQSGRTAFRAWSVGCSTGEEAYSLAILFREVTEKLPDPHQYSLQIFASDLSPDAISAARRGQFPLTIRNSVSSERLSRFFDSGEHFYEINKNIRDMVLFAQHDVVLDPPFTKLDLLICRNLLIYFDPMLQRKLLPLFHYSLRSGGLLLLGNSETTGRYNNLFVPEQSKLRFYLRQDAAEAGGSAFLLNSVPPLVKSAKDFSPMPTSKSFSEVSDNLQTAADHLLLQVYAPAAVVVNETGDIVYISGRTGKYLEPAAGKANWNFHAMVHESLRAPLAAALKQADTQHEPVHLHGLQMQVADKIQVVDVTVQALADAPSLRGMIMVVFRDYLAGTAGSSGGGSRSKKRTTITAEIQQYRDEILALQQEARASKEELQSSNEELQSTNEELQSANEELTTSKEEMQSMNEELQTINSELQTKLDDLSLAQSDMKNVLNGIDIAILFLDQNLNVRRYTDLAASIINLRESDIGRPLSDLTTTLQYPEMHTDAEQTLRTLAICEKQILSNDARWFSVRIIPYRRLDNMIDGVVLTLVDITSSKRLEASLRQQAE